LLKVEGKCAERPTFILLYFFTTFMTTPKFPKAVHTLASDQEFKQKYTHGLAD
jgi:hypothetical protein